MEKMPFYTIHGPLDATPSATQVRASKFSGFSNYITKINGDPRRIFEHHGIDLAVLQDPDLYLEVTALVDVFEYCASVFDDPLFGFRIASSQTADVYGCVTALCRAAPTVRTALECLIEYIPIVHSPMTVLELVEGKQTVELRYASVAKLRDTSRRFSATDQSHYQALMLMTKLLSEICGPAFAPTYVHLNTQTRPQDIPEIEGMLRCRFYKADFNGIGIPARMLDQPVETSNRLLFTLLSGYLDRLKAVSRRTIVERVEDYVRGSLPLGTCSIENCVKRLGISERTLQIHLNEHGVRFSEILKEQRVRLAQSYLNQQHLSLDDVAFLLGYSEQSSFGRAFKRWTGSTPQNYQQAGRS